MTEGSDEVPTPGWDAITAVLAQLYPAQDGKHFGTVISYRIGGHDPLDGISVYRVEEPVPHWHYVTFGFSELYAKESDLAEVSGFGFELTFRLERGGRGRSAVLCDELSPEPRTLCFRDRQRLPSGRPHGSQRPDPAGIGNRDHRRPASPATRSCRSSRRRTESWTSFRLSVSTADELAAARAWDKVRFLELLARHAPCLTTSLDRDSILSDSKVSRRDTGRHPTRRFEHGRGLRLRSEDLQAWRPWDEKLCWKLGAHHVGDLVNVLPGRICHGNPLLVFRRDETAFQLVPGDTPEARRGDDGAGDHPDARPRGTHRQRASALAR